MSRYQPYYCEENVYWLVQEATLTQGDPHAVFITSGRQMTRFMQQRISAPGLATWWDYHVVALAHGQVWDYETRLGMPVLASAYFAATFPDPDPLLIFRVVPATELLNTFTTDRSHMRLADGTPAQPPPDWSPPTAAGHAMNLRRFLDPHDCIAGRVLDQEGLRRWLDL